MHITHALPHARVNPSCLGDRSIALSGAPPHAVRQVGDDVVCCTLRGGALDRLCAAAGFFCMHFGVLLFPFRSLRSSLLAVMNMM